MILRQAWSRELGILFIIAAALNIVSFFVSGPSGSSALVTILGVLSQAIAFAGLAWWGWSAWSLQGAESATTTVAAE